MSTLNLIPVTSDDYRRIAEKRLPRTLFDYIDGGAYDERTLKANVEDYAKFLLRQEVMRDVSKLDTSVELFEQSYDQPVALAPVGLAGMFARRGEVQAKKAADIANVPYCLSTVGICSLEEVGAVSDKPFWFQLYMLKDRSVVKEILDRAKAVGVKTLLFTVDLAVVGARYRDTRNGMDGGVGPIGQLRAGLLSYLSHPRWLKDVALGGKPHVFGNLTEYVPKATSPADFKSWIVSQFDASVTWKDIEWLRTIWDGDLVIKGVLTREDALAAVNAGADGVVVSNHGGRQLDSVASSITALPKIVDALDGNATILVDGGIRSGLSVAKAMALGADGTLIGRPWVYANAAAGTKGVAALLATMKGELEVAMALTGITHIDGLNTDILDA